MSNDNLLYNYEDDIKAVKNNLDFTKKMDTKLSCV